MNKNVNSKWLKPYGNIEDQKQIEFRYHASSGNLDAMKEMIDNGVTPIIDHNLIRLIARYEHDNFEDMMTILIDNLDGLVGRRETRKMIAQFVKPEFMTCLNADNLLVFKWLDRHVDLNYDDMCLIVTKVCSWSRFGRGIELLRFLIRNDEDFRELMISTSLENIQLEHFEMYAEEQLDFSSVTEDQLKGLDNIEYMNFIEEFGINKNDEDDLAVLYRYQYDADRIKEIIEGKGC